MYGFFVALIICRAYLESAGFRNVSTDSSITQHYLSLAADVINIDSEVAVIGRADDMIAIFCYDQIFSVEIILDIFVTEGGEVSIRVELNTVILRIPIAIKGMSESSLDLLAIDISAVLAKLLCREESLRFEPIPFLPSAIH